MDKQKEEMSGKEEELDKEIGQEKMAEIENSVINVELSDGILEHFLILYKRMVDNISHTHFDKFLEILHNEKLTFPKDETVNSFRRNFTEELTESFKNMWNVNEIPQNLSILEILKERYKNRNIPQWRPYNKNPTQQTLSYRIHLLKKKRDFLMKQWQLQTPKLEAATAIIGKNRQLIEKLNATREILSYRIDENSDNFKNIQEQILVSSLLAIQLL